MANRVIIAILVVLVIVSGGLGYYSYTLNQQVVSLGGQLALFQMQQAAGIYTVNQGLADLSRETQLGIGGLHDRLDSTSSEVDSLNGEISGVREQVGSLADGASGTQAQLDALQEQLGGAALALSQSLINAGAVYQKISLASVVIGNGDSTVGSGFVYDAAGHVVTANHVVEGLSEIYVTYADGRTAKATSYGTSAESDVAVLTFASASDIPAPPLADSAVLKVGGPVIAIGNPFDLPGTLTSGIVSQTDRHAEIGNGTRTRWIANLIQFDAAVNYGNSGGLLANSSGEIVGMVIARVNPNEGDGIYYAVSSNKIKRVAESLIARGYYDYPWIGVNVSNITPRMVQSRGLDSSQGALVGSVSAGGPAVAAGIRADDVITAIDGVPVKSIADLVSYLGEHKSPNDTAVVRLVRNGDSLEVSLTVGKLP